MLQRHAGEGETIAEAIRDCLDDGKDSEKTESEKYIVGISSATSAIMNRLYQRRKEFAMRIALVMFLMIVVFWKVFGKMALRIFSVVPFLVEKAFCGLYLLVDIPVSYLHKKFGSGFGTLDNSLSAGGGKIDDVLKMWYGAWHSPKKVRMPRQLLIYILCMGVVLGPAFFKLDEKWRIGENLYIAGETSVINWFEQRGIYDAADVPNVGEEIIEKKSGLEETVFVVSGVNNSLLVRDIPDTENCMVLDRLKNDDEAILTGDMTFAETENRV